MSSFLSFHVVLIGNFTWALVYWIKGQPSHFFASIDFLQELLGLFTVKLPYYFLPCISTAFKQDISIALQDFSRIVCNIVHAAHIALPKPLALRPLLLDLPGESLG